MLSTSCRQPSAVIAFQISRTLTIRSIFEIGLLKVSLLFITTTSFVIGFKSSGCDGYGRWGNACLENHCLQMLTVRTGALSSASINFPSDGSKFLKLADVTASDNISAI